MIYLYIDIVMPVCTQSEKVSPSIPRACTDPESALIPVKASNCPSVEECKNVWEYLIDRFPAKELATREEDTVGHARFSG
jgi:hypothetical protein